MTAKAKAMPEPAETLPPALPASIAPVLRDRIVGLRRVKASDLVPNEKNWRLHPETQKGALAAMLADVGFVGALIARETADGRLELIDGHLRAGLAADAEVPVLVVDLNEEEAAKVLATYDPLSGLALIDDGKLGSLIGEIDLSDNVELRRLLTDLHADLIKDEKEKGKDAAGQQEVPGMALNPHEHYDYLVVLASTTHEWNVLCERLGLQPTKRRKSMGTCHGIKAAKLLEVMGPPKAPDHA